MILSDIKIKELLSSGELSIDPLDDEQIQPASVDMRLGDSFSYIKDINGVLNLNDKAEYRTIEHDGSVQINSMCFMLATIKEYIKLPDNITAFVEGRSSIGRMGLFIQNAGWVDPGFEGEITLELFNAGVNPIIIEPGRRICQLVFAQMDQKTLNPYRGKYQGQKKATGSKIHLDKEVDNGR